MRKKNNKRKANPIKRQAKVVIAIMDKMYEKQRDTLTWGDEFFEEFKVCVRPRIEAAIKSLYLRKQATIPNNSRAFRSKGTDWIDGYEQAGSNGGGMNLHPSNLYPIAGFFMKDAHLAWNDLNEIETVS